MTGKNLQKTIQGFFLMCSMLKKKKNILCLSFKTQLKTWKASYSFNNFKRKGRHYLAAIRLFLLLREATSGQNCDSYCLNCFHLFRTKNRHKQIYELKIFVLASKDTKILKFSQYYKGPYIKYVRESGDVLQIFQTNFHSPGDCRAKYFMAQ